MKNIYPTVRPVAAGGYPRISDPSNEAVPLIAVRVFGISGRGTDVSVVTSGPKGSLGTLHPVQLSLSLCLPLLCWIVFIMISCKKCYFYELLYLYSMSFY